MNYDTAIDYVKRHVNHYNNGQITREELLEELLNVICDASAEGSQDLYSITGYVSGAVRTVRKFEMIG